MRTSPWLHRFAIAAAVMTYLLLTVGGVVTSRDAGMVFLDWPLSEGSVNPEGWTTDPDKASEHGHRILGALVGVMTVILAVWLHVRETRRWVRGLGWTALVAVIVQGLLGGLRVTEISAELALLHGCTGQAFFCLMIALAYATSRDATTAPEPGGDTRGLALCAFSVLFVIYMQVVLGAQLRHTNGPIQTHLLGAIFVLGSVFWLLTWTLLRHRRRGALTRPVLFLALLLLVQVALGFSSVGALEGYVYGRPTLAQVLLPTAHQSVGALMLATSVLCWLRAQRRTRPLTSPAAEVAL